MKSAPLARLLALAFVVAPCAANSQAVAGAADTARKTPPPGAGALSIPNADPFPSTYHARASKPTVIRNVNIFTGAGPLIRGGAILLRDGKVVAVGASVPAAPDATVIDGGGRYVTPGLIDTHTHLGVYPAPGGPAHSDGNEATA